MSQRQHFTSAALTTTGTLPAVQDERSLGVGLGLDLSEHEPLSRETAVLEDEERDKTGEGVGVKREASLAVVREGSERKAGTGDVGVEREGVGVWNVGVRREGVVNGEGWELDTGRRWFFLSGEFCLTLSNCDPLLAMPTFLPPPTEEGGDGDEMRLFLLLAASAGEALDVDGKVCVVRAAVIG